MRSLFIFKKWLCHFLKVLRPAAAHVLFAVSEQLARLQAEKCFRPRTCRGRKRLKFFRRCGGETLRGFIVFEELL